MKEKTATSSATDTVPIGDDSESSLAEFGLEQDNVSGAVPRWTTSKPILLVNTVVGILMGWGMFVLFVPALFSDVQIAKPLIDWIDQCPNWLVAVSFAFVPLGALYGTIFFTAVAVSELWLKRKFMRM